MGRVSDLVRGLYLLISVFNFVRLILVLYLVIVYRYIVGVFWMFVFFVIFLFLNISRMKYIIIFFGDSKLDY